MAEEKKKEAAAPKEEKKAAHDAPEKPKSGGGLMSKTPVLLGGVMIVEALVLFAGFKMLSSSPKPANGAEAIVAEAESAAESHGGGGEHGEAKSGEAGSVRDKKAPVEVPLVDFRAPNKLSGRTFLYDVAIVVSTKGEFGEKVKGKIKDREALIKDRVRTIIAQSDPEKLGAGEPGLETLRRQVKYQLDEIVGEGLIDEVLIPRCIPIRTDY